MVPVSPSDLNPSLQSQSQPQLQSDDFDCSRFPCKLLEWLDGRCMPCKMLHAAGVPAVVWCELATWRYGAPCYPFTAYILVDDLKVATSVLVSLGWREAGKGRLLNNVLEEDNQYLAPPVDLEDSLLAVQLLLAANWYYELRGNIKCVYPKLPEFVDALIGKILDWNVSQSTVLTTYMYLFWLYGSRPEIKTVEFATLLRYEHRQLHLDFLQDVSVDTVLYVQHARHFRDGLLDGTYSLCECSVAPTDIFFMHIRRWRAQRAVPGYESYEDAARRINQEEIKEWEAMLQAEEEAKAEEEAEAKAEEEAKAKAKAKAEEVADAETTASASQHII